MTMMQTRGFNSQYLPNKQRKTPQGDAGENSSDDDSSEKDVHGCLVHQRVVGVNPVFYKVTPHTYLKYINKNKY